jgi:hypothetical protein
MHGFRIKENDKLIERVNYHLIFLIIFRALPSFKLAIECYFGKF